jgi:structural maintenance of chromosome 4
LTELNEQRNEKLARVKAVESEKNKLEDGKTEAEAYLSQENEVCLETEGTGTARG